MLHEREHENTYTNSAKNRMVDFLHDYERLLEANVQVNNYEHFLYGRTTRIRKMKHRLTDICEITMCDQSPPTFFEITMNLDGAQQFLEEMFEEADLTKYELEGMTYHITLDAPDEDKLDELSDKINAICSKQIRLITRVKSETMQRVQKAVQNEFISAIDAVQARRQVEKLHKELSYYFKYLACNSQMKLLGDNFQFGDEFSENDYARVFKLIATGESLKDEDD